MANTERAAAVRRLAHLLDDFIRIPGTGLRFGLDPVLGLLPGGGDLAGGVLSCWILVAAHRAGASPAVLLRMTGNIMIDAVLGAVPLVGDLFDAGWKANRRNSALLHAFLDDPSAVQTRSRMVLALALSLAGVAIVGAAAVSVLVVRWVVTLLT